MTKYTETLNEDLTYTYEVEPSNVWPGYVDVTRCDGVEWMDSCENITILVNDGVWKEVAA